MIIILILLLVPLAVSFSSRSPAGTSNSGLYYPVSEPDFIYDLSYEQDGEPVHELNILEAELELIRAAEEFLIVDLFLFNDEYDKSAYDYPDSVGRLTAALIEQKRLHPTMPVVLITDPLNNFYGAYEQHYLTELAAAGVQVVVTELNELKDSNPLLSGYYRCYLQWFGTAGPDWIPNFFDPNGPKVNLRSILKLANFKANHRKTLISEQEAIIASANPHDPSSYHSNVAVRFRSDMIDELLASELRVIEFSGGEVPDVAYHGSGTVGSAEPLPVAAGMQLRLVTERGIYDALIENIERATSGDRINIGVFYISDRDILAALAAAADRGVQIEIVADPNKDAFGLEKNGSPNRSALCRLADASPNVEVRWYNTHGEQYHCKLGFFRYSSAGEARVVLGSGNYTRRNLKGFNLETDAELVMALDSALAGELAAYFERILGNDDAEYTLPLSAYYEDSFMRGLIARLQERTGLCTW